MKSTTAAILLASAAHGANCWWQPNVSTTWNINLSKAGQVQPPFGNIEAFDADVFDVKDSQWQALKAAGIKTICYFSAGTYENWRPDADEFPKSVLGKPLAHWKGERWLDIRANATREIMIERMALAQQKGCDAIDPDNVDAYANGGGGFGLTAADAEDYVRFLASEAHAKDMACGLKNALAVIPHVLSDVDFAVNEQCVQYKECQKSMPFIKAGKPVFGLEYPKPPITQTKVDNVCNSKYRPKDFQTLVKYLNLNETVFPCNH